MNVSTFANLCCLYILRSLTETASICVGFELGRTANIFFVFNIVLCHLLYLCNCSVYIGVKTFLSIT